jgi:hypothetical protein
MILLRFVGKGSGRRCALFQTVIARLSYCIKPAFVGAIGG